MKQTDIFDRLNNTIGNHMEGKATNQDLISMTYEVDKYLLQHPHPHDLIKNNVGLSDVSECPHENTHAGHHPDQPHYCEDCGEDL